jgi:hypothetical protein
MKGLGDMTIQKVPRRAGWGVGNDQGGDAHNLMLDRMTTAVNSLIDSATSSSSTSTSTTTTANTSSSTSTTDATDSSTNSPTIQNDSGTLVQKGYFYGLDGNGLLTLAQAGSAGIEPMLLSLALAGVNDSFSYDTRGKLWVMIESGITAVTVGDWGWLSAKTPGSVTPVRPDVAMAWRVCTFTSNVISSAGLVQAWVNIFAQAGGSV